MEYSIEREPVIWEIQYCAPPAVLRYCKKCGRKSEYVCAEEFRVNAQQKTLDIWLIYRCTRCNTTWNSTIYSRISPQRLGTALLERFYRNDEALAMQYAMDVALLKRNGVETKLPDYRVAGENVVLERAEKTTFVKIQSRYLLPLKLSCVLRAKLGITRREFDELVFTGRIRSHSGQDLRTCRLASPETILAISQ